MKTRFYILYRNGVLFMLQVFILLLFGRHLCQQDRGKDQYAAPISRRESCSPSSSQPAKTEKTDSILKMMEAKITLTYF